MIFMTKFLVAIIIFSFVLLSCRHSTQELIIKTTDTENSQNRFCFIHDIKNDNQKAILIFDLIEQKKDSSSSQSNIIELPKGYYFSNNEKKLEAIELDSNSILIMQTFSFSNDGNFKFNQKVNLTDFMKVFTDSEKSRFKIIPFRIVSTGTKIDSLFEIYIP
jgi:hypothetical protein